MALITPRPTAPPTIIAVTSTVPTLIDVNLGLPRIVDVVLYEVDDNAVSAAKAAN